ncbi:MAG: hypothetical protein IJO06_09100 [Thermoguttaceae bacterium]|nr:hypothetical protein [Thermoguttaceae bacterium]
MKSFFHNLSNRFPFFANRPSALERAVRPSPKSRRLRMEPLENRALLAVDAFGGAASLAESNVEESWGPDPEPAAFSASVLATDAAIVDVSGVNATPADASFSVQTETPEPVAPPSFDQLMEALGMIEIELLDDESDVASLSCLDEAVSATQLLNSLNLQDISRGTPRQVVFYDSSAADFDASTLNLDDESVYYVDAANANDDGDAESYSATPRSGGNSGVFQFTTYGSTTILESATYNPSGGSNQGPFFAFTTPASIPSGYEAFVRFEGTGAIYGHDYYVATANIVDGVATPQHSLYYSNPSQGNYDLYVSGGTSYCIIPMNDNILEAAETLIATLYLVNTNSGGADYDPTPIACDSFNATIIDDDGNVSVYWSNGSGANGAELSGNPNGGGSRVYPEEALNADGSKVLRDSVNLNFVLKEKVTSPGGKKVFFKLLDPTNYLRVTTPQINDNVTNFLNSPDKVGGNELYYNEIYEVTIPYDQTAVFTSISFSLPELPGDTLARAGDNFIVVADTDRNAVSNTALGVSATDCYQVVRDAYNPNVAQTQLLTVWRTLWTELDQNNVENLTLAPKPDIGLAVAEFERACISIREYPFNNTIGVRDIANGNVPTDWRAYIQAVGVLNSSINFAVIASQDIVSNTSNTNETTVNTTITVYQGVGDGSNDAEKRQRATFAGIQSLFPELNISLDVGDLYQYGNRTLSVDDLLNVQRSQILR